MQENQSSGITNIISWLRLLPLSAKVKAVAEISASIAYTYLHRYGCYAQLSRSAFDYFTQNPDLIIYLLLVMSDLRSVILVFA